MYEYADEILVAYGPTGLAQKSQWPEDGTLEAIQNMPDPDNKIKIYNKPIWPDKLEMRQFLANKMDGNFQIILDGDEIWTGVKHVIDSAAHTPRPRGVNFWHNQHYWNHSGRWGEKISGYAIGSKWWHYRCSNWRYSYYYQHHPTVIAKGARRTLLDNSEACYDTCIWHLGHCLPKSIMEAKHRFYLARDGKKNPERDATSKAWYNWDGIVGDCGDGTVEKVNVQLPKIVRDAFESIRGDQ